MMKINSLSVQLLSAILFVFILGLGVLFYFSYTSLKDKVDESQHTVYTQKINNIIFLIEQKYKLLQRTGMIESYEESFKEGTIKTINEVFYKNGDTAFPFMINEHKEFILHPNLNSENKTLYTNKTDFLKVNKLKNGDFIAYINKNKKWIIFKHFKPWDWIIGYSVETKVKYKELNAFKTNFLLATFFVLVVISSIVIIIIRFFITPITELKEVSKKIALGKYNTNINIQGVDEFNELTKNFKIMRDKILEDISRLKEQETKIKSFNKKLHLEVQERTHELLEQRNTFETLFYGTSDGISLLKGDKFIDCNQALLVMLKYDVKEDFLNTTPYELSPQFQPDGVKSEDKARVIIDNCLKKGRAHFEWVHLKSTGEEFWAEIVLTRISVNNDDIIHAVWRDIQDKKQLEFENKQRSDELEESNEELQTMIHSLKITHDKLVESEKMASLGSLVAGVAHEINTPVGIGLTGASHFLYITEEVEEKYANGDLSEEEFDEYVKKSKELAVIINANLDRTSEIIKSFKQVAIDQTTEQKRVFNVLAYIQGILISIDNITKKKDIKININCKEDMNVNSYPGLFAQIVTNLIINAMTHAFKEQTKGIITIDVVIEDNTLKLLFSDDGIGIKKEELPKIYEPFYTTNREHGSSGLGLNIIYNIVTTNLKGNIHCVSEEGKGTTFHITFPLE